MEQEDEKGPSNVEYVSEQLDLNDASLEAFADVFARFQLPPEESSVRCSCFFLFVVVDPGLPVAGQI